MAGLLATKGCHRASRVDPPSTRLCRAPQASHVCADRRQSSTVQGHRVPLKEAKSTALTRHRPIGIRLSCGWESGLASHYRRAQHGTPQQNWEKLTDVSSTSKDRVAPYPEVSNHPRAVLDDLRPTFLVNWHPHGSAQMEGDGVQFFSNNICKSLPSTCLEQPTAIFPNTLTGASTAHPSVCGFATLTSHKTYRNLSRPAPAPSTSRGKAPPPRARAGAQPPCAAARAAFSACCRVPT